MTFLQLPNEIFLSLKPFLPSDDYFCLLNTSKTFFQQLKRDHAYFTLTFTSSARFLKDKSFRLKVLKMVKDPCRQIEIKISNPYFDFKDGVDNITVHKICSRRGRLSCAIAMPYFPFISIYQGWDRMTDISRCSHLQSFQCELSKSVTDISCLSNIPDLRILAGEGLTKETLSRLGKQKILKLGKCPALSDVTHLRNVQELIIDACPNLTDLRPLHGMRSLAIEWCRQISDISPLGDHYKLSITNCAYQLRGYHILRQIPIVHLRDCNISDLSVLQYAREVNLWGCHEVSEVSHLKSVRKLYISSCFRITDISSLNGVRELTAFGLPSLTIGIDVMNAHCLLSMGGSGKDKLMNLLYQASHKFSFNGTFYDDLELARCLPNLRILKIAFIHSDFSLKKLAETYIHTVHILDCIHLTSIEGLGNNRCVELENCRIIRDVSCLRNVSIVKIKDCPGITDYSCLREVPRLQLQDK